MRNFFYCLVLSSTIMMRVSAQTAPGIVVPKFDDKYSRYVQGLETGKMDIDYQDFRFSFLDSEQFKVANGSKLNELEREMRAAMAKSEYPQVIRITQQMLSLDYTSLIAHKILRQTYKIMGDTTNATKYKTIQFGLLNSITRKGDGKTCATAWPIIQLAEEYFFLEMIDARLKKQNVDKVGGFCDKMEVRVDGEIQTYYFDVNKVFLGYNKLGLK